MIMAPKKSHLYKMFFYSWPLHAVPVCEGWRDSMQR
jgi:hypothetical protein